MSKYVLGISAYYHDSGASLICDGEIIGAVHEERFSRIKGDSSFPEKSIEYLLKLANISPAQITEIAYYENPYLKFDRQLSTFLYGKLGSIMNFIYTVKINIKKKLWVEREIKKFLNSKSVILTDHHLSHAASAFYPSPFEKAAIITLDGVGEWSTATIGFGDKGKITLDRQIEYPNSLGLLYSAFTVFTGFKVNSGEYKLMGLAPFGEPKYYDVIRKNLVKINEDGSFILNPKYFEYFNGKQTIGKSFEKLFGRKIRKESENLESFHADIAASIQKITNEIILKIAEHVRNAYNCENLVLAGGVALNVVSIGVLERSNLFKNIWVQPAAGDAGGSLGAALWVSYNNLDIERIIDVKDSMKGAFLGPKPSEVGDAIGSVLDNYKIIYKEYDDEKLAKIISKEISQSKVVAIAKGRMEFGPRALGSRSVLADARVSDMQTRLNLKTKYREGFRPFAPIIKDEDGSKYFEQYSYSPYMLKTFYLKKEFRKIVENINDNNIFERVKEIRSTIPSVTHIDFSSRAQSVGKERNPFIHSVLTEFEILTGLPILINTSFNVRGEPIVCSSEDAIECFLKTDIDILVLESYIIYKDENIEVKPKKDSAVKND